jgi:hypothetical protein
MRATGRAGISAARAAGHKHHPLLKVWRIAYWLKAPPLVASRLASHVVGHLSAYLRG